MVVRESVQVPYSEDVGQEVEGERHIQQQQQHSAYYSGERDLDVIYQNLTSL